MFAKYILNCESMQITIQKMPLQCTGTFDFFRFSKPKELGKRQTLSQFPCLEKNDRRFSPQSSPSLFTTLRIFHADYRKFRLRFQSVVFKGGIWILVRSSKYLICEITVHQLIEFAPFFEDRTKLKILSKIEPTIIAKETFCIV